MRAWRTQASQQQKEVGFVATMGYLHEGHLRLIDSIRALHANCAIVVSIFVNPTQFGANEDLDCYPRDEKADLALCAQRDVDVVFLPQNHEIYPDGSQNQIIHVSGTGMSNLLCGLSRPVHFGGVLTVVSKFFNIIQPDYAAFGMKDFQQLRLLEVLVRDLNFPVQIIRGETVREADGLAKSSRNAYLQADERKLAPILHSELQKLARAIAQEPANLQSLCDATKKEINMQIGADAVEYLECRAEHDLNALPTILPGQVARLFIAAKLGQTRLIDNEPIPLISD